MMFDVFDDFWMILDVFDDFWMILDVFLWFLNDVWMMFDDFWMFLKNIRALTIRPNGTNIFHSCRAAREAP